jgi:hypothetical protein
MDEAVQLSVNDKNYIVKSLRKKKLQKLNKLE